MRPSPSSSLPQILGLPLAFSSPYFAFEPRLLKLAPPSIPPPTRTLWRLHPHQRLGTAVFYTMLTLFSLETHRSPVATFDCRHHHLFSSPLGISLHFTANTMSARFTSPLSFFRCPHQSLPWRIAPASSTSERCRPLADMAQRHQHHLTSLAHVSQPLCYVPGPP